MTNWNHEILMRAIVFEVPNPDPEKPSNGWGVLAPGQPDHFKATYFASAAVNKDAECLVLSAPMLYQSLGRISASLRMIIDSVSDAVASVHKAPPGMDKLMSALEAMERDALTIMSVATDGVDRVEKSLKGAKHVRK